MFAEDIWQMNLESSDLFIHLMEQFYLRNMQIPQRLSSNRFMKIFLIFNDNKVLKAN